MASAAYKKGQESSIVEKDGPNSIEGKNTLMELQDRFKRFYCKANELKRAFCQILGRSMLIFSNEIIPDKSIRLELRL